MTTSDLPYRGQSAALASQHGKEAQIAPALGTVGLRVVVAGVDTDAFGTFTGEIPREGSPLQVAERKARAGMAVTGLAVGLASEGSFGPHPAFPFATADLELVVLVDDRNEVVVVEHAVSADTAAAGLSVAPLADPDELRRFCRQVGFPDQALICRPADGQRTRITKAITTQSELLRAIEAAAAASADHRAVVETDLRAHLCPTRRPVIAEAATRLARRLARRCPACGTPGFGQETFEAGLPCELCRLPTSQAATRIDSCPRCGHQERHRLEGAADVATCGHCNP